MNSRITAFISAAFFAVFLSIDAAALELDPVFTSNMVLQQEAGIAFFGTAAKDTTVTVEFAGKTVSAKTDADGKWRADFPAMKAGATAYSAKIADGKSSIELSNILIGDVWVCAGQSNMEMPVGNVFTRGWSAQNCKKEVQAAEYPMIRYADQKNVFSHNLPRPACLNFGGWVVCSPQIAGKFSATAYFFARELHKALNIPIGLINTSWSGTRIETWISREGYQNAKLENDLKQIQEFDISPEQEKAFVAKETARYQKEIAEYQAMVDEKFTKEKNSCAAYAQMDFDDSKWQDARLQLSANTIIRWYRTKFTVPAGAQGQILALRSKNGPIARASDIYLNGKKIYSVPAGAPDEKQEIDLEIKPEQLDQNGQNVLAIRAVYYYHYQDQARMHCLINGMYLHYGKKQYRITPWKSCDEVFYNWKDDKRQLPAKVTIPYEGPQFFCNLYNGMVDAWTKLPIKGVIWYQGCNNAGQLHYLPLHKALIADWRAKWKQPDMPFIIVQLAGYGDEKWTTSKPDNARFAVTRDIQMQLIRDPKVGLACAIDIGEPKNIHPANKQEVGRRLALEAERIAYGKDILSRGPIFRSAELASLNGGKTRAIRVIFDNADHGLKTSDGKAVGAFAIAGVDKKFVWADAVIDGNTVLVSSPSIQEPMYVRYAFAMYRGDCNLCNAEGLPAYPFRSDAFDYSSVK